MAIFGVEFLGYDPTAGLPAEPRCPKEGACATIVWFEKWAFFGNQHGRVSQTGITYNYSWTAFDMLGNVVTGPCPGAPSGCGFTGNETCLPHQKCKDDDEWLAYARDACNAGSFPPPGTVQFVTGFGTVIGV